jgi:hypothetical protein|tara:strand:- start:99 stop:221 length:123 start_codon:yes stop_codon:yes gene_type:complete
VSLFDIAIIVISESIFFMGKLTIKIEKGKTMLSKGNPDMA